MNSQFWCWNCREMTCLPWVFLGAGLYVCADRGVLVQTEIKNWRSGLVSEYTAIFGGPTGGIPNSVPADGTGTRRNSNWLPCLAYRSDSLRIVTRAARRPTLFPQLFPIPNPRHHRNRQRESELMSEHTHLPAMVGFVSNHVAQHLRANRPGPSPAVSAKCLDPAPTAAERFSQHLRAASGAFSQSRTSLLRRAMRAGELSWNLQVRSRKPDPLASDIVQVRKDRRNRADLAGRLCSPGGRVKMFDKNLIHAIVGGKNLDCGSSELSVNLV
jgi:hypothetical protein